MGGVVEGYNTSTTRTTEQDFSAPRGSVPHASHPSQRPKPGKIEGLCTFHPSHGTEAIRPKRVSRPSTPSPKDNMKVAIRNYGSKGFRCVRVH